MTSARPHPLLGLDPELGRLLSESRRQQALAHLQVSVEAVPVGEWDPFHGLGVAGPEQIGLLVIEGVVSCELLVEDTVSGELLGPGDVLRPAREADGDRLLPHSVRWSVLASARIARLDARFTSRLSAWPEVNSMLIDRLNARAHRLATTQAISQLNGVDRRVQALLWHLAERWGRMTPEGVLVPLPLSHRVLSRLVGARRPSVSTALGALARRGEVLRQPDETWLLTGEPTGLPAAETERVVPIRRRLFGREGAKAELAEGPPHDDRRLTAFRARVSHAEVHANARRVHADAERNLAAFTAATARSRRLVDEARARMPR